MKLPVCGKRNLRTTFRWGAEAFHVLGAVARDEGGAALVEYALILALLTIACIAGTTLIGNATLAALNYEQTELMSYAERNGT